MGMEWTEDFDFFWFPMGYGKLGFFQFQQENISAQKFIFQQSLVSMYSFLRMFLDEEQALLIILLLLSVPISYLLGRLRSKYLILGVSITFSFIFQTMMYGAEKYILWVQQHIVYLILRFAPRHKVGRYVIIETFLNLAAIQIRRMYISYGVNKLDITGILMMQTFLYVGLAYNYQNGVKPDHQLSPGAQARRVKELPDYLTYIGYCFFLPACLVGPVFEFRDYEDYLNQKGDYENIPNTLKAGLKELGIFLTTLGIYVATMSWNLWYTISPQFAQSSYAYKIWYILATIFNMEFKYITAWSLGMISIHCSGLSYNKQNNSFDKIQVTKIMGYFLDPSLKVKTESWNMSIQMALKRYIYEQDYNPMAVYESEKAKKRAQNIAQRNTMLISALWHGFYPGYFISFFHWIFYLRMNQDLFRLRRTNPKLDRLWTTYRFGYIENLLSNFVLSYFGIYIHLMTFQSSKRVIMATYGIPFVILYGLYFVVNQADLLTKLSNRPKKEPIEVISGPGKSRDE